MDCGIPAAFCLAHPHTAYSTSGTAVAVFEDKAIDKAHEPRRAHTERIRNQVQVEPPREQG